MVVFSPATIDILQTPSKFSLRKMVPASARSHFKNCQPAQVRPAERIFCRADPLGTPDHFESNQICFSTNPYSLSVGRVSSKTIFDGNLRVGKGVLAMLSHKLLINSQEVAIHASKKLLFYF